ncbi:serine hydrolase [Flavobacterium sp. GT3P67]|uniref:serine hydrolase n=1 Tax=Flavobacterium sp. GT3P67 TaxID=2541722 RepID=UPI0010488C50|nr:serine hydrolase [Flavobacterium sp. GT3P67]TDE50124.1 serine hydrolase [Flavobacterium sp. GT3P67]
MKQRSNHFTIKTILIGLFIHLITITVSFGQTKADQIDKLMNLYSEYGQFNGSILVADAGKVIYKKGFGMANMEWNIPNQPDTKHRLGSVTKQFTAMLIIQLVEQGKLKLDAPITTYLPDYHKTSGDKITIHHLLTHTSGIPNYTSFPNFFKTTSLNPYSPEAFVKIFADLPLEFTPGEKFAYSNSGYFLLGYIIEKVSGKTYEQCLQDNILTSLKMKNTGFDHHETILKNRASGYEKNGKNYSNASYLDLSIPYAAGSLYSTVDDLYLWDQALYTDQLLSTKYNHLLFNSYIPAGPGHYGYGWFINKASNGETNDSLTVIEHGGGINGFNTLLSRIPADKNLVVLLNNTGGTKLNEMNIAIRNILYNKPYNLPKKSLANALVEVILEKGIASGLAYFKENKNSNIYAINENEMNSAGYQLLQTGKEKEAIEVFKLNIEAFPQSGNAYDSLGEAYLKNGDKKLAILNYKKSVELDPNNESGKKVLEEISKS